MSSEDKQPEGNGTEISTGCTSLMILSPLGFGIGYSLGSNHIEGMVIGLFILGIFQSAVFRPYVRNTIWWIFTVLVGCALFMIIGSAIDIDSFGLPSQLFILSLFGAYFGSFQWLILRGYFIKAGTWIIGNALGMPLAYYIANAMAKVSPIYYWMEELEEGYVTLEFKMFGVVFGGVLGAITGILFSTLQNQRISDKV